MIYTLRHKYIIECHYNEITHDILDKLQDGCVSVRTTVKEINSNRWCTIAFNYNPYEILSFYNDKIVSRDRDILLENAIRKYKIKNRIEQILNIFDNKY